MTHIPLTPKDWPDGLHEACRELRQHWPNNWPGLPHVVALCQQSLGLNTSSDSTILALNRFATLVAQDMEHQATLLPADTEPCYHNRLHTGDVLLTLTTMLHTLSADTSDTHSATWSAALLAAAVAHDYQHPGGVNQSAFEIEAASWQSVSHLAEHLPLAWQKCIEALILGTDTQTVADNHRRITDQPFGWNASWCQVLLNEADILISATAEFGPGLSESLAREWKRTGFPGHATVATPAGRAQFLRSVRFSSPAAKALRMHTQVQQQLTHLSHQD